MKITKKTKWIFDGSTSVSDSIWLAGAERGTIKLNKVRDHGGVVERKTLCYGAARVSGAIGLIALCAAIALMIGCNRQMAISPEIPLTPVIKPQKNAKVWLNREDVGTIDDLSALADRLKSIIEKRQSFSGDNDQKQNDNPGALIEFPPRDDIYLRVDANVSIGNVKTVSNLAEEIGGEVFLLRESVKSGDKLAKDNPYVLIITVGEKPPDPSLYSLPVSDEDGLFSSELFLIENDVFSHLQVARVILGGIEILDDGTYVLNQKYVAVDGNKALSAYPTKQKPLPQSGLAAEITRQVPGADKAMMSLLVIASARAPFRSLINLRETAGNKKLRLQVDVHSAY